MTINFSTSAGFFASAGLIILFLSTGFLLPVILDITKSFYIEKSVINADNTIATKIPKDTI